MEPGVFAVVDQEQILDFVIKAVMVPVMNALCHFQCPPQVPLHDETVLKDRPPLDSNDAVAVFVDATAPILALPALQGIAVEAVSPVVHWAETASQMVLATVRNFTSSHRIILPECWRYSNWRMPNGGWDTT